MRGSDFRHSVSNKKARLLQAEKCIGIFWPTWMIQKTASLKKCKLRVKKAHVLDGEKGFILDTSHGNPSGTSRITELLQEGISMDKEHGNEQFMSEKELDALFTAAGKARAIKVGSVGKVSKHPGAPVALKITMEVDQVILILI